jgi:hydroxymethylbilane synthase
VAEALTAAGRESTVVVIETAGDRRAPDTAWGEGAFVAAIERALLDDRVDVAVHSAKDVPTDEDPRLRIAAYLPRADPRDALVMPAGSTVKRVSGLPSRARIGTDSPRRTGFLLAVRPDLRIQPLHGNVDTRLRRLDAGDVDALVLACAGLDRLGRTDRIAQRIDADVIPPAPGQGAIAIQVRADDRVLIDAVAAIDDAPTRAAVQAERAFLQATGGGCRAPIGALATLTGSTVELLGGSVGPDGSGAAVDRMSGPVEHVTELGRRLAARMALVPDTQRRPRILVTRTADQATDLVRALRDEGLEPVLVPAIEIVPASPDALRDVASRAATFRWLVVTSSNGARAVLAALGAGLAEMSTTAWAAVGAATSATLEGAGVDDVFQPSTATADALARELPVDPGDRVLIIRGDLGVRAVAATLRARGVEVEEVVAYRTLEAPGASRTLLRAAIDAGPIAAIVLTSGSTARGLAALAAEESIALGSIPAVCIGAPTADAAIAAGLRVVAVSADPTVASLAGTVAAALATRTGTRLTPQLQEAS